MFFYISLFLLFGSGLIGDEPVQKDIIYAVIFAFQLFGIIIVNMNNYLIISITFNLKGKGYPSFHISPVKSLVFQRIKSLCSLKRFSPPKTF